MKKKICVSHGVIFAVLLLFALAIILPLIWIVITGFKSNKDIYTSPFALPSVWLFKNYVSAWKSGIGRYLLNSVIVTAFSTLISAGLSCLAAYPLSRMNFKMKRFLVYLIMGGLMLAPQSSAISLFKMMGLAHLIDTRFGLELVTAAFNIPFATFLIMTFFKSISPSLDEAAFIDGATTGQVFFRIILPLSKPILASCCIISFRSVWNELLFANIFLQSNDKKTIPVGLINMQGMTTTKWGVITAGMVLASVPLILLFLVLQKQFIRGLTLGGVKG